MIAACASTVADYWASAAGCKQAEISRLQRALDQDQFQRQAVEAERRCEALEHQLPAAEESVALEAELGSGNPSRFTVSYAGPDRPWAVWIRQRLETIGHEAAVQRWDPPAGVPVEEELRSGPLAQQVLLPNSRARHRYATSTCTDVVDSVTLDILDLITGLIPRFHSSRRYWSKS
ncbi:toll/interleukin-1 receptor domain-containing protein [Streptomyces sp. 8N616]|uniref:toll/interleukin-1 receptor domain-containing protein n=1 Tax=Streptomyces sp. 8N616 TaxID=3457414 RepID=UPI003FD3F75C